MSAARLFFKKFYLMKKISLLFVLSIVSVFSISAQTSNLPAANINAAENVKIQPESAVIVTGTVKPTAKTSDAEEPKPETNERVKKPETPVLAAKKTLGGLSTGNSTVDGYIEEFSELFDVDPLLIFAQMSQESSFRGRATSSKGASGYMQLMPDTARRFGVTNIYNPKQNIKAGIKYMRWLLDKFGGDVSLALAGYNAGEGAVIKYGNKIPPYRETQNYVARIINHYELISNQDSTLAQNEQ
jgi:soluble lytic murein transglycosylase-like protein